MQKRFVLWAAVSSLPQVEKVSLEHQTGLGRQIVAKYNGHLVAELIIPGESRDIVLWEDACREIAAYAQLRDLIRTKAFDVFVFLNPSRLGRTAALIMAVSELCRRAGIVLYDIESPPASLDTQKTSHADLLVGAIKSVGAQNEIIELKRRHSMGMADRARKGLFPRGAPWGWLQTPDGKFEVNPQAQRALNILINLYLQHGAGQIQTADRLNDEGFPSPNGHRWTKNSVFVILDRIWTYAGYAEINRRSKTGREYVRAKGIFPALIDDATARAVEEERRRRVAARRSVGSVYRFSQCVYCQECDRRMNAQMYSSGPGQVEAYYCKTKHAGGYISERKIIRSVRQWIERLSKIKDLTTMLPPPDAHVEEIQAAIADLEGQIGRYQGQIEKADDAYVQGIMDADRYKRQVTRINGQIADTQRQIEARRASLQLEQHRSMQLDRLREVVQVGLHMLTEPDPQLANAWFRAHCKIWVTGNRVIGVDWL